ncbi:Actin cytoskeleton-regulatory complex protein END3 [Candida viswanathii]|uniref:Actin cytoskeleton-regulatory complex protein END3 n=1 Tax=Candida viswanathii TaxID=5486 RepID=A0A367XPG5_9ASCO|nr:Actin cytoskeleton-regulatory complex protein END3 [Candida viswanathii]
MPRLEESEIKKYWQIFQGLKPTDNKLTGDKVSPVLKNSRLPESQLSLIWELSDIDNDGKLDFEEFCIVMRLIFDLINGNFKEVPDSLPSWLIPSSKIALIQANKAVNQGNNDFGSQGLDDDLDEDGLRNDFDWYISPTDRSTYEKIYDSNSDSLGRIRFNSLNGLYDSLKNAPREEISSAWNLVNPKSFETIDKDQTLVFLHILNQRENGKRIPRGVPASLRATFSKEVPNYDLDAQAKPAQSASSQAGKRTFAEDYLTKIGGASSTRNERGTDFSATEGTDWEEVRLRRELHDLEQLLDKVSNGSQASEKETEKRMLVKYEFEQLLKYKQDQLSKSGKKVDLALVKRDVDDIQAQVSTLEDFLNTRNQELAKLNQQVDALK